MALAVGVADERRARRRFRIGRDVNDVGIVWIQRAETGIVIFTRVEPRPGVRDLFVVPRRSIPPGVVVAQIHAALAARQAAAVVLRREEDVRPIVAIEL